MSDVSDVVRRVLEGARPQPTLPTETLPWSAVAATWEALDDLGLTRVGVPEDRGGSGGSVVDACDVVGSIARASVSLPVVETSLLAGLAVTRAGLQLPRGPLAVAGLHPHDRLTVAPDGRAIGGRAFDVAWAVHASHLVLVAPSPDGPDRVSVVPASQVVITPGSNVAGEPCDTIEVPVVDDQDVRSADDLIDALRLRGALGRAVQILGALATAQELTISHASTREQFGRPIGRFQAVAQLIATMAADHALAAVAVEAAVRSTEHDPATAAFDTAVAKVMTGRAARRASAAAHQVHGAIGVTAEHPLHLATTRLWAWQDEFGPERHWLGWLGRRARVSSTDPWELLAPTHRAATHPTTDHHDARTRP